MKWGRERVEKWRYRYISIKNELIFHENEMENILKLYHLKSVKIGRKVFNNLSILIINDNYGWFFGKNL